MAKCCSELIPLCQLTLHHRRAKEHYSQFSQATLYQATLYQATLYQATLYQATLYQAELPQSTVNIFHIRDGNQRE